LRTEAIRNMSEADYFADPALSQTAIKIIRDQSPAHFRAYREGESEDEESEALMLGSAFDLQTTDPARFAQVIAIRPAEFKDYRTKAAREWRTEQNKAGRIPLTIPQSVTLSKMLDSINRCPDARELMSAGENQVSLFAPLCSDPGFVADDFTPCKGRVDRVPAKFLPRFGKGLADIKTAKSAHPVEWGKSAFDHGYHIQSAWYLDLWNEIHPEDKRQKFFFLVVEKTAPYPAVVYEMPSALIQLGRDEYAQALRTYNQCVVSGVWPDYGSKGVIEVEFPAWALKDTPLDPRMKEAA